ncbi:MAG: hypothetical protein V1753_05570 [Pseudomonadota bacterium]
MKIAYFITQHGYGHAFRSAQVINALPDSAEVFIVSNVEQGFFYRAVTRTFSYRKKVFDVGCIQTDSINVDIYATLEAYSKVHHKNYKSLKDEIAILKDCGISLVISDSASFPMLLAAQTGIPGILLASFTWIEIYQPYMASHPEFEWLLGAMRGEYDKATLHLRPPLSLDISYGQRLVDIPLIAPAGNNIRDKLVALLGVAPSIRLGMLYFGSQGLSLSIEPLSQYQDWYFVTLEPLQGACDNCKLLDRNSWRYEDIIASSDAVVGKLGYGLLSSCMAAGMPIIYPPRSDFVEHEMLDNAARKWGGGIPLSSSEFFDLNIRQPLEQALTLKPKPIAHDGANVVAQFLMAL